MAKIGPYVPRTYDGVLLTPSPAFILGCGPTLPERLNALDGLLTFGVNRVFERIDPTVFFWLDSPVAEIAADYLKTCRAVKIAGPEAEAFGVADFVLQPLGSSADRRYCPPPPGYFPAAMNSGASAAFLAMALGCNPIYLLGMSATAIEGRDHFSGVNPLHQRASLARMSRALAALLEYPGVFQLAGQPELDWAASVWRPSAKGRENYARKFINWQAGVYPGQRPPASD